MLNNVEYFEKYEWYLKVESYSEYLKVDLQNAKVWNL